MPSELQLHNTLNRRSFLVGRLTVGLVLSWTWNTAFNCIGCLLVVLEWLTVALTTVLI